MRPKHVAGLTVLLLSCSLVGYRGSPSPAIVERGAAPLREARLKAYSLYQAGKHRDAERAYQAAYRLAVESGDKEEVFRCLNGVGGVRFAMFQYRDALESYLEARSLAQALNDGELLAAVSTNLSSLYLQQQEINAGARAAEQALEALRHAGPTQFGPLLRTQSAILHSRQNDVETALALFGQALDEADLRGDAATLGLIWDQLGYELLTHGNLDEAERALVEGFRIRKLNGLPDIQYSYYTLGLLRSAQGDAATARRLLGEAISRLSRGPSTLALWRVYHERGRASLQAGQVKEALPDLLEAVEYARRIRLEVLPADSVWINTGVDQHGLYSALIRAAAALHLETGDQAYAELSFEAAEENRAAALRALILSPDEWRKRLPSEYWETLAQLRGLQGKLLGEEDAAARRELDRLQYRMTEMEAAAGLSLFPGQPGSSAPPGLMRRVQKALGDGEAYFSFHLDEPGSCLWVLTRRGSRMFRLPGRTQLEPLARRFKVAVAQGSPEHARLGEELYHALFGAVPESLLSAERWSLALEGDLWEAPLAALVVGASGKEPIYLAETRVIRLVPSAHLLERRSPPDWSKPFVAVGDPIYNTADQRWPRRRPHGSVELPRLAGSGREIAACARAWGVAPAGSTVLTGGEATLARLDRALMTGSSVLHFATHFVPAPEGGRQAMIALSLDSQGSPELLSPAEVARKRLDLGVVVLSGCASASGVALPAEGLMGMTRGWLAAGARSVLATLWPTPDDEGRLLEAFYTLLSGLRTRDDGWAAAEALRGAQLRVMRSGDSGAPRTLWAAYVLAARD